ncbi:NAD-P-binding protein [Gymnopilus junonius]|uniref:D-xylose 1-dehydrogenase (NADP(+), D-xylono-1,5-lactone-forming) n=1 Tax=Gymnopilus junonius TaxID=109634 RepID=A0A9P5TTB3_GYMJU|nr:NAD-P-binding protein [Gymnopilus junonius]
MINPLVFFSHLLGSPMAEITPLTLRWGIISTGGIAAAFVKDLLVDPKTRGVHDIQHQVVSVGSRSVEKAQEFIDRIAGGDKSIKAFGTYEEVYLDKDIDAVYIGTPHTYHYTNALDGINAGKHILCEKPVTCNVAELRSLIAAAKEHNVFFMEAMWTRFQPLSLEVKRIAEEGRLGLPVLVHADLSGNFDIHSIPTSHRILDPALGGGALLDIGPYPLFWAILALYENPANNSTAPTNIAASMLNTPITPVDSSTCFSLTFSAAELSAQASLTCSITLNPIEPGVTIRFDRGAIVISSPIYCPKEFKVQYLATNGKIEKEERRVFDYVGGGWYFEADEVARCVRDGKKESELWGHDKSLLEMNIFDEVRRQGGYKFPPGVEKII